MVVTYQSPARKCVARGAGALALPSLQRSANLSARLRLCFAHALPGLVVQINSGQ